jgi:hypothetical protein
MHNGRATIPAVVRGSNQQELATVSLPSNNPSAKRPVGHRSASSRPGPQPCNQIAGTASEQIARALRLQLQPLQPEGSVPALLGILHVDPRRSRRTLGDVLADLVVELAERKRRG